MVDCLVPLALSIPDICPVLRALSGSLQDDRQTDGVGIGFINELEYKPYLNIIEYLYYYNGGGVAVGDINNDGLDDIFFTANQKADRLYLNMGDFRKDGTKL